MLALLLFNVAWTVHAQEDGRLPDRIDYVSDYAQVISEDAEAGLNRALARAEEERGVQIYVLTVPTTEPLPMKEFTARLWESWGLNKEDPERQTLIFLVATEDGLVRLSTSTGLAEVLSDEQLAEILKTAILPAFGQEAYEQGIVAGIQEMLKVLSQEGRAPLPSVSSSRPQRVTGIDLMGILVALALVAAVVLIANL
jgi:uncharacterized protein